MDSFVANRVATTAPATNAQSAASIEPLLVAKLKETDTLVTALVRQRKASPDDIDSAESLLSDANASLTVAKKLYAKCPPETKQVHEKRLASLQTRLGEVSEDIESLRDSLFVGSDGVDMRGASLDTTMESGQQALSSALQHSNQAMQMGMSTVTTLQSQRAQLERTQEQVQNINQQLDHSEYLLRGIKSLGGAFSNLFRSTPQPTVQSARSAPPASASPASTMSAPSSARTTPSSSTTTSAPSSSPWGRATSTPSSGSASTASQPLSTEQARESLFEGSKSRANGGGGGAVRPGNAEDQQMAQVQKYRQNVDQGLSELQSNVLALKGLGLAINTELDQQNKLLDALDKDVDKTNARVEKNTKEIRKIL